MLPYYNPFLPHNPQQPHQQQHINGPYQNPAYSSHYIQAYVQSQPGYYQQPHLPGPSTHHARPSQPLGQHWYQPGSKRCTYRGCTFTGSRPSVEIHMMDRHLIYPPGWEKRQKNPEWDADPSLRGKPIPIQGTNAILDDPEQLAAWIAERKKRFPTSDRVVDMKRKMDEAVARGQLTAEDIGLRSDKRRKVNDDASSNAIPVHPNINMRGRGRGSQVGRRGRGRGGSMANMPRAPLPPKPETVAALPPRPLVSASSSDDGSSSSDSEGEPEVQTSKKDVESMAVPSEIMPEEGPETASQQEQMERPKEHAQQRKRLPPQPKKPPRNPFASRPSLLRNLIAPEIRITVSNLSQAIRFLVDNDFLRGVELKPGEADGAKIQVLDSHKQTE